MSEENVELVRKIVDAFARRDHEYPFQFYDADIEWDATGLREMIPDLAGVYHGHDGIRAYWRLWLAAWRDITFEVEDILDGGDEIVILIRNQRQWGRHSGLESGMPDYAFVVTVRDGMVTRWRTFADREEGLKAAGLAG